MNLLQALDEIEILEADLAEYVRLLDKLYTLGALTKGDLDVYYQQAARLYRLQIMAYSTLLQEGAKLLPLVEARDLARVVPAPQPFPPLPYRVFKGRIVRMAPAGLTGLGLAPLVVAGVTIPVWALVVGAIALVVTVCGVVYIRSHYVAEIEQARIYAKSANDNAQARATLVERCIAAGGTPESCTTTAVETLPEPTRPQPIRTPGGMPDPDTFAKYIVWGVGGLAVLSLLPVITGAFQSLRGLGGGSGGGSSRRLYLTAGDD